MCFRSRRLQIPAAEFFDYVQPSEHPGGGCAGGCLPFDGLRSNRPPLCAWDGASHPGRGCDAPAQRKGTRCLAGFRAASHDAIVIADDDIRCQRRPCWRWPVRSPAPMSSDRRTTSCRSLARPAGRGADARRSNSTEAIGQGTLGVRRSAIGPTANYDGNVLFENLELVRTIRAAGEWKRAGRSVRARRRRPRATSGVSASGRPTTRFARPPRLAAALVVRVRLLGVLLLTRRWRMSGAFFAVVPMLAAEMGRRRAGGRAVFRRRRRCGHPPGFSSVACARGWRWNSDCCWAACRMPVRS